MGNALNLSPVPFASPPPCRDRALSALKGRSIQRDHELLAVLNEQLNGSGREVLKGLLDLIERTVPVDRVWLDVSEQGVPPPADIDMDELTRSALSLAKVMAKTGMRIEEELDLHTLVCTRGRNFPMARIADRLCCPRCGCRRVAVVFDPPKTSIKVAV